MHKNIYGYLIGSEIRVDIEQRTVSRIYALQKQNYYMSEAVFLSETSMALFIYLLENAKQTVIPYENILSEVWDKRGLISSYKRLNQVTKELRDKLNQIGLAEDFILTIRSRGYRLKEESITQLYSETIVADS
ncbi:helix-turn-helix domain-containing protein [Serratia sp. DD3]|uniref:winged helix-turn-helix domain-containing protein n=2 Tax=Serratia sp. DD3 TaxID=1410619 RepID=UPI0004D3A9F7|nr:helix-turn-helix domain-containing protein [Serratia sp. DD3]KEY58120.1 hypothetical protein SRDD_28790 [Serratia sp. DD3]